MTFRPCIPIDVGSASAHVPSRGMRKRYVRTCNATHRDPQREQRSPAPIRCEELKDRAAGKGWRQLAHWPAYASGSRRDGREHAAMGRYLRFVLYLLFGICMTAAVAAAADLSSSVTALLTQSAHDWNRGDLDAFMRGYERSPETTYISRKGIIRGYAAIRARYAAHYGKTGMGALSFSGLSVRPLGERYAAVTAHWHLAMANGRHPTGVFALLLHRSPSGWHIINDYTP